MSVVTTCRYDVYRLVPASVFGTEVGIKFSAKKSLLLYFLKALKSIFRLQKVNYVYILFYAPFFCKVSPLVVVKKKENSFY
jgi:hypothetical protein